MALDDIMKTLVCVCMCVCVRLNQQVVFWGT